MRTPWSEFWRKFRGSTSRSSPAASCCCWSSLAILAPWIVPYDAENFFDYDTLNAPPSVAALVRRRLARPRHLQPHPDGRAHLACRGLRLGGGRRGDRHAAGPGRRVLRRLVGPRDHAPVRRAVRLPRHPARHRHRRHPRRRHGQRDHRRRDLQHPDVRPPGARQHAGAQAPHLHRGGAQHRRVGLRRSSLRHIFPGTISAVVVYFSHAHRHLDHHRGEPVVPRHGRAAADAGMGRDARTRRART